MKKNSILALVFMITIIGFLNADQNIINSTLGSIEAEFHVNDADMGLIGGLFTLLGAVVSLIWGYLSDKGNRKKLFTYSVLIGEIPCLLTAFVTNYDQFFILRVLTGIGVGASFPTIFSMIGDMYDAKMRAVAVTWVTTMMGIGQIIGQLLNGYLAPIYGWRFPFLLVSIPNIIIMIIFYLWVSEPQRGASEDAIEDLVEQGYLYPKTIKLSDYVNLFKIKTNLFLFISGIIGMVPWGAIPFFLVKFLNENKGFSIQQATTVFLLFGIGITIGTVIGGIVGGDLAKRKALYLPQFCAVTTAFGAVLTLALFILMPSGRFGWSMLIGFSASFLVAITGPNVRTMLLDTNVPENRGAIFSLFNLTDSVGAGIGKFIGGNLSVAFGLGFALNVSAAVWFPCAILFWICALVFPNDIKQFKQKITIIAQEMRNKLI